MSDVAQAKRELLAFISAWRERNDLRCSEVVEIMSNSVLHFCPDQWGSHLHRLADEVVKFRETADKLNNR